MITETYDRLLNLGFTPIGKSPTPTVLIVGGGPCDDYFMLARHLNEKEYYIHAARDSNLEGYDQFKLIGSGVFDDMEEVEQLKKFLLKPTKKRLNALEKAVAEVFPPVEQTPPSVIEGATNVFYDSLFGPEPTN